MTDNPYQAPKASLEVASPAIRERGPPPASVSWAVRLLWVSAGLLAVFLLVLAADWARQPGTAGIALGDIVANLLTIAVLVFFAGKVSKARNWARWVFGIGVAVGTLLLAYAFLATPELWQAIPFTVRAFNFVQNLLQLGAVVLLFLPESNAWFSIDAA